MSLCFCLFLVMKSGKDMSTTLTLALPSPSAPITALPLMRSSSHEGDLLPSATAARSPEKMVSESLAARVDAITAPSLPQLCRNLNYVYKSSKTFRPEFRTPYLLFEEDLQPFLSKNPKQLFQKNWRMLLLKLRVYYDEVIDERLHLLLEESGAVPGLIPAEQRLPVETMQSGLQSGDEETSLPSRGDDEQPPGASSVVAPFEASKAAPFAGVVPAPHRDLKKNQNPRSFRSFQIARVHSFASMTMSQSFSALGASSPEGSMMLGRISKQELADQDSSPHDSPPNRSPLSAKSSPHPQENSKNQTISHFPALYAEVLALCQVLYATIGYQPSVGLGAQHRQRGAFADLAWVDLSGIADPDRQSVILAELGTGKNSFSLNGLLAYLNVGEVFGDFVLGKAVRGALPKSSPAEGGGAAGPSLLGKNPTEIFYLIHFSPTCHTHARDHPVRIHGLECVVSHTNTSDEKWFISLKKTPCDTPGIWGFRAGKTC